MVKRKLVKLWKRLGQGLSLKAWARIMAEATPGSGESYEAFRAGGLARQWLKG